MPKTEKRPSPKEWAKSHMNPRRGPQCWICKHADANEAVEEFFKMKEVPPYTAIREYLKTYFAFPRGASSFLNHLKYHRGER